MPRDSKRPGAADKLNKLRASSVNRAEIIRFFRTSPHMNAITGLRHCFGCFTSAIRRYFSFCELRGRPPFPARKSAALEWCSISNPRAAFSNYVNYLKKACFSMGRPTDCDCPSLANIIKVRIAKGVGIRIPEFPQPRYNRQDSEPRTSRLCIRSNLIHPPLIRT